MTTKSVSSNDNQLATRAELEASNRELRASLRKCEDLVSDCKVKLLQATTTPTIDQKPDRDFSRW